MPTGNLHILSLLFLGSLFSLLAEASSEQRAEEIIEDSQQAAQLRAVEGSWVPVPIPVSNPTVGNGLQVVLMYLHPKQDADSPHATSGLAAMYTGTDSWFVGGFHDDYFKNDQYRLLLMGGYGVFNLDYYGIGNISFPPNFSLPYEIKGAMGSVKYLVRLPATEYWYGGVQYLYLDSRITFNTSAVSPLLPDVVGNITTAALGGLLTYDSRDDNYYPSRGQYAELKAMDFGSNWGGDYKYEKFIGFYTAYIPLTEQVTLAARTRVEASNGDVPFFNLAYLDLRGFARGRYQNQHSWSLHGEARYKFLPRWGVIAFYETGWVNDDFSQMTSGVKVTSTGAGLRWQPVKDKAINLGLDVAYSTDDKAIYIQIGESY